ncbi:MAG TPA: adenosylhomocysteinase [Candidatus Limnocylindria bacterium]|jgi:adenosylhomocysteinase|nr:adenosylhomocysteinase [Candidatus Limnocylindria bacterium]
MTTTTATPRHDVADLGLADVGSRRTEWAGREMPVLAGIRARLAKDRPFAGLRIAACLHVTTETANLATLLRDAGASVALCASNPLSTQDDAAAALVANEGIAVFARKGEDRDTYYRHINAVLETKPQITMDDGADVVTLLHTERKDLLPHVKGGTEETTTGVIRLRAMAADGVLAYPIVAVNEAQTKHMFDNQYGTGQSAVDGILRATNILLAGKTVVVCGYGWVGRGVASRFRGMGSIVIIVEVDPLRGLEAAMDGYQVMPVADAARRGDLFITCTGNVSVIAAKHFTTMKDGAILANAGHFNDEIELGALEKLARSKREVRRFVEEYDLGERKIFVLGEGRLVNHVAAEANPAAVMDMSFANQALAIEYLVRNAGKLAPQVYPVPRELDEEISRTKLEAMGMRIDKMTEEQAIYSKSWKAGT